MKNLIKTVIESGNYKLADIQRKLKRFFLDGDIAETEYNELMEEARQHSTAEAEKPGINAMLQTLIAKLEAVEKRLDALEGNSGENTPDVQEKYDDWKPWDGVSKDYQKGAIVLYNGELWQSIHDGQNVWQPGVYGWEKYTEGE